MPSPEQTDWVSACTAFPCKLRALGNVHVFGMAEYEPRELYADGASSSLCH